MECQRCGLCCEKWGQINPDENGRCSELEYRDGIAFCRIYETRPDNCRNYPKERHKVCLREKMAQITLMIQNSKLTEFKTGFLATHPVPVVEGPKGELVPKFTEAQWIKEWTKRQLLGAYKHGKRKLAQKAAQVDEEIIE